MPVLCGGIMKGRKNKYSIEAATCEVINLRNFVPLVGPQACSVQAFREGHFSNSRLPFNTNNIIMPSSHSPYTVLEDTTLLTAPGPFWFIYYRGRRPPRLRQ